MTVSWFSNKYKALFQEVVWPGGPTRVRFEYRTQLPPLHLISNVNIVPFVEDLWVVIRLENRLWEIPGGTLEPEENYLEAIERELMEEVGARLKSFELIGAWHCISEGNKPYRSYLPFPEFYRIVGVGEIELVEAPRNPRDGERVIKVEYDRLEKVEKRFSSIGREDLKELYQLGAELKLSRGIIVEGKDLGGSK